MEALTEEILSDDRKSVKQLVEIENL